MKTGFKNGFKRFTRKASRIRVARLSSAGLRGLLTAPGSRQTAVRELRKRKGSTSSELAGGVATLQLRWQKARTSGSSTFSTRSPKKLATGMSVFDEVVFVNSSFSQCFGGLMVNSRRTGIIFCAHGILKINVTCSLLTIAQKKAIPSAFWQALLA